MLKCEVKLARLMLNDHLIDLVIKFVDSCLNVFGLVYFIFFTLIFFFSVDLFDLFSDSNDNW